MDPATMLALGAAGLFAAIGIGALAAPRFRREPIRLSLAGVGEISAITVLVGGVACVIVSYHIVTHALGVLPHFRAPLWIAFLGAGIAVLGSIGIDSIDNRREAQERDSNRED
jgi:hypothetical protein